MTEEPEPMNYIPPSSTQEEILLCLRVEAALGAQVTVAKLDWREAVARWGVRSPAALGCLLDLVRKAWRCPSLRCGHEGGWGEDWDTWTVDNPPGKGRGCEIASSGCASEIEAMVVALESAAENN